MTTSSSPIVFIVDDEEDMRLAMQRILKTVNLRAELFATAQDFLQRNIPDVPSCLVPEKYASAFPLVKPTILAEDHPKITVVFLHARILQALTKLAKS